MTHRRAETLVAARRNIDDKSATSDSAALLVVVVVALLPANAVSTSLSLTANNGANGCDKTGM